MNKMFFASRNLMATYAICMIIDETSRADHTESNTCKSTGNKTKGINIYIARVDDTGKIDFLKNMRMEFVDSFPVQCSLQ